MQNREAFTRLAAQYINTVYRVAYAYLRSAPDAEDVTQKAECRNLTKKSYNIK